MGDPAKDIDLLSQRLTELGGADLLIVDPIVSAVSGDAHRVNDVRRNLQALVDAAAVHRCAVLGISHFAKGTKGSSPAERVIGSQAFVALARMVLVAGKDEGAERRILARAKSNIAADDGGFGYSIEQVEASPGIVASRIVWGEFVGGSARDILGDVEHRDDQDQRTALEDAMGFLRSLLAAGPVPSKQIKPAQLAMALRGRPEKKPLSSPSESCIRRESDPGVSARGRQPLWPCRWRSQTQSCWLGTW